MSAPLSDAELDSILRYETNPDAWCVRLIADLRAARAELAQYEAATGRNLGIAEKAEARLAAVIALCDAAPLRSQVISKYRVRAIVTGEGQ